MRTFINLVLLLFSFNGFSQTKVKSFYFLLNQKEPTQYSQEQIEKFAVTAKNGSIIILEVNAFTDSIGTVTQNDNLANERLSYVASRLPLSDSAELNPYGLKRPYEIANVLTWRRVDVVYSMNIVKPEKKENLVVSSEENIVISNDNKTEEDLTHLDEDPVIEGPRVQNMFEESIKTMKPLVLDISFKEGTSRLLETSYREVKRLGTYLKDNPEVNAQVRGHVCCGNNMRISKSRAKAVYRRLIKQGIDKDRLSFVGMSNKEPLIFPEETADDRQTNRRVDVKFTLSEK